MLASMAQFQVLTASTFSQLQASIAAATAAATLTAENMNGVLQILARLPVAGTGNGLSSSSSAQSVPVATVAPPVANSVQQVQEATSLNAEKLRTTMMTTTKTSFLKG